MILKASILTNTDRASQPETSPATIQGSKESKQAHNRPGRKEAELGGGNQEQEYARNELKASKLYYFLRLRGRKGREAEIRVVREMNWVEREANSTSSRMKEEEKGDKNWTVQVVLGKVKDGEESWSWRWMNWQAKLYCYVVLKEWKQEDRVHYFLSKGKKNRKGKERS